MQLRVSGIQMEVTLDVHRNAATICRAVEQAASAGADILLTPEAALSGYTPEFDPTLVAAELGRIAALARERRVGLALGTCFREVDGLTYNQLRFYSPDGAYLGFHSKILRCGSLTDPPAGEVNQYADSDLRVFTFGEVTVGGLICNDLWANPACTPMPDSHLTHQLAVRGARVIFHAVNGGRDGSDWSRETVWNFHDANLRLRAAASKVWIVTVDNCHPVEMPCSAPGGVVDPRGQWVCRTSPQGEQFFTHAIDLLESV